MNEQLQKALADMIGKSIAAFEHGAEFLSGQIPDVVHQLLLWYAVKNGIMAAVAVLVAIVGGIGVYKAFVWERKEGNGDYFGFAMGSGISGVVVVSVVGHLWNLQWLQIWIAPKIWLIEYAARMVTK